MRPACLDDPEQRCHWDDDTDDCPCMDPEPEPRPIETVPTGELL